MRQRNFPKKGKKYHEWTVLGSTEKRNSNWYIECQCSCGFKAFLYLNALRNDKTKMCKSCATALRHANGDLCIARKCNPGCMDIEPIHFVSHRQSKQHQGRLVTLYKGTDGCDYTVNAISALKKISIDTIRKRMEIYGIYSPLLFWPGRITQKIHQKNKLKDRVYPDSLSTGPVKTRSGKIIPELTEFEKSMPLKEAKVVSHKSLFRKRKTKKPQQIGLQELTYLLATYNIKMNVKTRDFIHMEGYSGVYVGGS